MPCVSCRCTQMYKIRVGSITSTKTCVHGAVLRGTLLGLHQVQQTDRQGAGCAWWNS